MHYQWVPPPSDEDLPVLDTLPAEYVEMHIPLGVRAAWLRKGEPPLGMPRCFHYCRYCGGWVPGEVTHDYEHTLAPYALAGRDGDVYYCRRCGKEIAFFGMQS